METSNNTTFVCETSYTAKKNLTTDMLKVLVTLDIVTMALNIITNVSVIISIVRTKQLFNISMKLIFLLSISDCCLALVTQLLFALMLLLYSDKDYCSFEAAVQFFAIFLTHTSGYIIALIGFDRFARMKFLNRYSEVVSKKRISIAVAVIIMLSFIQALLYVVGTLQEFFASAKQVAVAIDFVIAAVVIIFYVATVFVVRQHRKNAANRELLDQVDRAVTRLASLILLSIIVFYITYVIISVSHSAFASKATGKKRLWLDFFLFIGYILTYCNSFVNAVIFLALNRKARRYVLRSLNLTEEKSEDKRDTTHDKTLTMTNSSTFVTQM